MPAGFRHAFLLVSIYIFFFRYFYIYLFLFSKHFLLSRGRLKIIRPQIPSPLALFFLVFSGHFRLFFSYIFCIYLFPFFSLRIHLPHAQAAAPQHPRSKISDTKELYFLYISFPKITDARFYLPGERRAALQTVSRDLLCRTLRKFKKDIYKFFWLFHCRAETNRNVPSSYCFLLNNQCKSLAILSDRFLNTFCPEWQTVYSIKASYIFCIYLFQNCLRSVPVFGAICILQRHAIPGPPPSQSY